MTQLLLTLKLKQLQQQQQSDAVEIYVTGSCFLIHRDFGSDRTRTCTASGSNAARDVTVVDSLVCSLPPPLVTDGGGDVANNE